MSTAASLADRAHQPGWLIEEQYTSRITGRPVWRRGISYLVSECPTAEAALDRYRDWLRSKPWIQPNADTAVLRARIRLLPVWGKP